MKDFNKHAVVSCPQKVGTATSGRGCTSPGNSAENQNSITSRLQHAKEIRGILTDRFLKMISHPQAASHLGEIREVNRQLVEWEGKVKSLENPKP